MPGRPTIEDNPFVDLANLFDALIQQHLRGGLLGTGLWLGTITDSYGLQLDNMQQAIPDYLISEHLALAEPDFTATESADVTDSGGDTGHGHSHQVQTPAKLQHLHPGDRVLAAALHGGADWVVLARVMHIDDMPR